MNVVPLPIARVSNQLRSSLLLGSVQGGQLDLLKVQEQISTGKRLSRGSDDPAAAVGIERLRRQMDGNAQTGKNLTFAGGFLDTADAALGSLTDLIAQAKSVASAQVGATSTPAERQAQAAVVESMLSQALALSGRTYQGAMLFGGAETTRAPFLGVNGGYKYQGSTQAQGVLMADGSTIDYTVDGNAVFGGRSSQVTGYRNVGPALTAGTRLADLAGARLKGVASGKITVSNGTTTTTVDLSGAATVGDVQALVGNAVAPFGATVGMAGGHLTVTAGSGAAVTVADAGAGTMAADLGIAMTAAAGTTVAGTDVGARITATTPLAALRNGAGVDPSGLVLTNGTTTATIGLAGLTTVQNLVNAINGSGTQVHAEINAAGTGLNLINPISGIAMTVGENGGTTADDLGLRSLQAGTLLADLNGGAGVTPISKTAGGQTGNMVVTKTTGGTFSVKLDGVKTVSQLIAAINGAAGNGTVTAAANPTGNGITLTDTAAGSGNVSVAAGTGYVSNGTDLGLFKTGAGATLTGGSVQFATDDFKVTRRDGTSFTVSVAGARTVQDVIAAINSADGNGAAATKVTAGLAAAGNGIVLSDASGGPGALVVAAMNGSPAAGQLGIYKSAGAGSPGVVTGDDVNALMPGGVFSALAALRDALKGNDTAGITRAAAMLEADGARVLRMRGEVGARGKDIEGRQDDLQAEELGLKKSLSLLEDTDFTEAATRFQTLQTAFEATLKVAQSTSNLSLLDFLK